MAVKIKENYSIYINGLVGRINQPTQLLSKINSRLKKHVSDAFKTAGRSTGEEWAKHSEYTKMVRERRGTYNVSQPILVEYGNLRKAVVKEKVMGSTHTGFKTRDEKASLHQEGFAKLIPNRGMIVTPPRPVYRLSGKFCDQVAKDAGNFLVKDKGEPVGE
ncbi:MAG: phage virion morphogenesis protein [Candidatus Hodarchaeota archaeon]